MASDGAVLFFYMLKLFKKSNENLLAPTVNGSDYVARRLRSGTTFCGSERLSVGKLSRTVFAM